MLPPTRQLAKDDSLAASSETQATVPVSSRKEVAQAPNLSARPRTTNDTAGVLLSADDAAGVSSSDADGLLRTDRQQATDDSHGASSVREATMPPSIPRDAATAPILPEGVAPTFTDRLRTKNITPGEMLTDEADESILFLQPHR